MKKLSKEVETLVIDSYKKSFDTEAVRKEIGCGLVSVYRILKRNGIERKPISEIRDTLVNSDIFTDFSREPDAYFFGFLLADGNLSSDESRRSRISIDLADKDTELLVKFREFIGKQNSIVKHKTSLGTFASHYSFSSYVVYNRLISQNMLPQKTMCERLPNFNWLDNRDFWRGMVDGDGSLCIRKGCASVYLCGSLEVVTGFAKFCWKNCFTKQRNPVKDGKRELYRVVFYGEEARNVLKVLYGNCEYFLDRKYNIAKRILLETVSAGNAGKDGVHLCKKTRKYKVCIRHLKKQIHLGVYSKFEDAVEIRAKAEGEYFGKNYGEHVCRLLLYNPFD